MAGGANDSLHCPSVLYSRKIIEGTEVVQVCTCTHAHAHMHTLFLLSPLNTAISAGDPQQTEKRRGGGLAPPRPGVPPLRSPRHHHGHRHLPDHAGLHCHLVQRRHRQSLEMRAPDDITAHARREACVYGHTLLFPMNTVTSSSRDVVQTGSEMLCCRL